MTLTADEMMTSCYAHVLPGVPVLLAFSRGKDSVGAWALLDKCGIDFTPYYLMQAYGGLPSEHRHLDRIERLTGKKIHRYTHPGFWDLVRKRVFSAPGHDLPAKLLSYEIGDVEIEIARFENGWDDWQVANGCRKSDSHNRMMVISRFEKTGWLNPRKVVYPVADLRYDELELLIEESGIPLPHEYRSIVRSTDDLVNAWLTGDADDRAALEKWFPAIPTCQFRHAI